MDTAHPAIVVAVLPHGEHGAVVRFLTEAEGVVAGYVAGGRSRALRPVLQPGNGVALRLRRRTGTLPGATVELTRARTALGLDRATAAATGYLTALVASVVDEGVAHPRLYAALDGVLEAMALAADPTVWQAGLVRFELLLLAELGFGLDLSTCAATGALA
ncbi:MAG: DNA repair protein RecO, partial [Sphingomonadaceae bacterium]|nr:DNA repair protein RecO [Sphingomonadaceae bacterium]